MSFLDTITSALQALVTHKGRSILTLLGIVIGIGAIIIVMSIGQSAQDMIVKEIQSFGSKNVYINPGKPSSGLFSQEGQAAAILSTSLTLQDVQRLQRPIEVPDAVIVNPTVQTSITATYESQSKVITLMGSGENVFSIYNISLDKGELFTKDDVDQKSSVILLGKNIVKDLFDTQDPIGKKIEIKKKKFKVIGIFSSKGTAMFGIDDMAVIPYTTAQQYILGNRSFQEIAMQAKSTDAVPAMVQDIKRVLRDSHNITDPAKDDFIVSTQEDIIKSVDGILNAITVFLSFVAALSLLVGGVGVMNIMLVSVTERTKEIGLRKAIGATNKNILTQFLLEAVILTGIGGIVGIIGGSAITYILVKVASLITNLTFPFYFSVQGIALGVLVACGTGIVFGIFPAYRASKKSPMEALHYE